MRRLRREESGFTLIEMITAMTIGLIVSFATFTLIEVVVRRAADITDRVDTTQRARTAMDQITRQLRSQVCTNKTGGSGARTIDAATSTSISVFTDFSNETVSGSQLAAPDLRTITFDPAARTLTESVLKGSRVAGSNAVSYSGAIAVNRRILANITAEDYADAPAKTKPVIFRYWGYPLTGTTVQATRELVPDATGNLTADQLDDVVRIDVTYRVLTSKDKTKSSTVLENSVFVRTSTPNAPKLEEAKTTCTAY
jgi:prepilin-type N-terminal cleavage/methylation domain-containing protein